MAQPATTRKNSRATPPKRPPSSPRLKSVYDDSDIARRAYDLFRSRGYEHGRDVEDWLQAERELRPAQRSTGT
jgi:hypothetical protein